ncbi:uncharacterized protein LOC132728062 [Ruditapes philippinarum]|uniref:uncharacterized protein LOC132728062 n=1 Tax=Ruditapes philippinarum TaxID=129788 RepID=UPI00295AE339|nr:uncharacterized protein LOC132728062 [Ruditapes philippinarum]
MGCCNSTEIEEELDPLAQFHESTARQCDIKPNYFVLEIGFYKGHGLQVVLELLNGGPGRVMGTETSEKHLEEVTKKLHEDIDTGTLELDLSAPESLSYLHNMFDCVYNVNGFYYWDDIKTAACEIYRVLRPGCLFLTCIHDYKPVLTKKQQKRQDNVPKVKNKGISIQDYADILREQGFANVRILEHRNIHSGFKYQTVQAFARKRK